MILYFSGTGNSRFVAKELGHLLDDQVVSLNYLLKEKKKGNFDSQKPYVIVTPSYMSRMPLKVEKLLMESHFHGNQDVYFLFTAGQAIGNADHYCQKICQHHSLNHKGTMGIQMPANYVVMYDVLDKSLAREKTKEMIPLIDSIAKVIENNGVLDNHLLKGHKMFSAFSPAFHTFMVSAKKFYAEDCCIHCGECTKVCPLNNIQLKDGKPVWGNDCMHCMACISVCPQEAIQYGKKTKKRHRYYLDIE